MVEETLAATLAPVSVMDDTIISDGGVGSPGRLTEGVSAMAAAAPASSGRYVVLGKLGAGAMGEVLAAYDPRLDRKVALKRIHPGGAGLDAARIRLEREAQALAKLDHRNVVKVHDVIVVQGGVFVAMEFVEGQTLGEWMRAGPRRARPWTEVVPVFEAIGRGLGAVHAVGLIHRDVKPGNVMIGSDERVRVMDFGLARLDDDDDDDDDHAGDAVGLLRSEIEAGRASVERTTSTSARAGSPSIAEGRGRGRGERRCLDLCGGQGSAARRDLHVAGVEFRLIGSAGEQGEYGRRVAPARAGGQGGPPPPGSGERLRPVW